MAQEALRVIVGGAVVRRTSQVEERIRKNICNLFGVCSKGSVRAPEGDRSLIRGLEVFLDGTLQLAALDDRSVYRSPGLFLFRFLPFIEVVVELPHFFSETGVGGWGEGIGQLGEFFLGFGRGCPSRRGGNRVVGLRALTLYPHTVPPTPGKRFRRLKKQELLRLQGGLQPLEEWCEDFNKHLPDVPTSDLVPIVDAILRECSRPCYISPFVGRYAES